MNALLRLSIRTRLLVLVGTLVLLFAGSTVLVTREFAASDRRAATSTRLSAGANALAAAYEGWELADDQTNMYVALLALKDETQMELAQETWRQAVDGHQTALDALELARTHLTAEDEVALLDRVDQDLATFDAFSQQVRVAGEAGDVQHAVRIATVDNAEASSALPTDFGALRDLVGDRVDRANAAVSDAATSGQRSAWIFLAVGAAIGIALATLLIVSILRPLRASITMLGHIAAGRFDERVAVRGSDELARVGTALNDAAQSLGDARDADLAATVREREQREREDAMRREAGRVREEIAESSRTLAAAAEELQVVSEQMGVNSAETSSQVDVASRATTEVNRSVESVSSAAEQMSASIKEIARNATEAASVAAGAVDAARLTSETINRLGESSAQIGEVVKVITTIAEQTNLLALNATIEAARAGEAGKGFAVVANEVKELAKGTSDATEDISARIEAIQTDTAESVASIQSILCIIDQIANYQQTIAAAVEEQAATTTEITRAVHEASKGSSEIMHNMSTVSSASASTAAGAHDTQQAARELARMADGLQHLVDQFRI